MKTLSKLRSWAGRGRCYVNCLLMCLLGMLHVTQAQDLDLKNPSLEGPPKTQAVPQHWYRCGVSPDIQPSCCSVTMPPSAGNSYVGMQSGATWEEGIEQKLDGMLLAGRSYTLSFDLAYPPLYYNRRVCYGRLAIYGSRSREGKSELLWKSEPFDHQEWRRYTVTLRPAADYAYLSFYADFTPCSQGDRVGVLIDNLSAVKELPQLQLSAVPSCPGIASGVAAVGVRYGQAPFTYRWMPGNHTSAVASGLAPGVYEVTVTGANGAQAKGTVTVGQSTLQSRAAVKPIPCYGEQRGSILVQTSGGLPPYRYYLNDDSNACYNNEFNRLAAGTHKVKVRDEQGCANELDSLIIEEPAQLTLQRVSTIPASCNGVSNGQVAVAVTGGTPPYAYRMSNEMWQRDSVFPNLARGSYHFEVKDGQDCLLTGNADVTAEAANCMVVMPTAFTPNGDGMNDVFRPRIFDHIRNYQLSVYNRWGSLVFRSDNPANGWNGTYNGEPQLVQAYIYICTFTDSRNENRELKGAVLLMR